MVQQLKNAARCTGVAVVLLCTACNAGKQQSSATTGSGDITGHYWKLIALDDQPVKMAPGQEREAHVMLKRLNSGLAGYGGCNGFGGSYELLPQGRVRFFDIISTMMACEGTNDETRFLAALRSADRYTRRGDTLRLYADRQSTATFEAVYLR